MLAGSPLQTVYDILYDTNSFHLFFCMKILNVLQLTLLEEHRKVQYYNISIHNHILMKRHKQCLIKWELHRVQNPHCSSRPEPRQVAANSFTQSISSSALNSALQTSTTAFITFACNLSSPSKYFLRRCQSHHLTWNMEHLGMLCVEGWTIFAYTAQTAVKMKTRMQTLVSRLGCRKGRLQVINIPFEYKHTVVSKSKTIFKCTQWILVILIQYV